MKKRKASNQIDMLNGSLLDKILIFAIPLALSSILQQLFNSADVAVVGRFAGKASLAAVGSNGATISLFINLFVGLSVGANVVIANLIGQNERDKIRDVVHTVILVALISGFFLAFIGFFLAKPLLILMDTPSDVLNLATVYLKIYFLGMPFIMIYNFGSAVLRSKGDTKRPMYTLIVSGIVNVLLNLLLVIVFHLGVVGVAIATLFANAISATIVLYFLIHEEGPIQLHLKQLHIDKKSLIRVIQIGAPAGLQNMVFSISNVCIQTGINSFGSDAVAGSAAAINFEYMTYYIVAAFGQAAVTFISQNYGAEKYDRCKKAFRLCLISSMLIMAFMSTIFVAGRGLFVQVYTTEEIPIKYALIRMVHVLAFQCLTSTYEISAGALRGMGYSLVPALITIFGSCGLRIVWLYTVFKKFHTYEVLVSVYPVTWALTGIAMMITYFMLSRKLLQEQEKSIV